MDRLVPIAWPNLRSPRPSSNVLTTIALRPAKRPFSSTTTFPFLTLHHRGNSSQYPRPVVQLFGRCCVQSNPSSPLHMLYICLLAAIHSIYALPVDAIHLHAHDSVLWCSSVLLAPQSACQGQPIVHATSLIGSFPVAARFGSTRFTEPLRGRATETMRSVSFDQCVTHHDDVNLSEAKMV